jgi:hypothetical protein
MLRAWRRPRAASRRRPAIRRNAVARAAQPAHSRRIAKRHPFRESTMLSHIPLWVPAILLALLLLGYRLSRTRRVAPSQVVTLALAMLLLSLYGVVAAFGAGPEPLLSWALGIAAALALGVRAFGPRGLDWVAGAVQVPGSWLPLGLMLGIFTGKFILGFATGIGSPIVATPWFIASASLVFGLLSGGFVARALAVHRFARSHGSALGQRAA